MDDPSATRSEDGHIGTVYPDKKGKQILTRSGKDIVPGDAWEVGWMPHPDHILVITMDQPGLLVKKGGSDPEPQRFIIRPGGATAAEYTLQNKKDNISHYYNADLITPDRKRRRALDGKDDSGGAVVDDTTTRPRIIVGNGSGMLPDPADEQG